MSHQSGQSAGGAFGYGFGPGSGGVNAATDSMGDLSVQAGGSGAKGVGMDGGLGLQFGNFGAMGGGAAAYRTVVGPTRANNGHSTGTARA